MKVKSDESNVYSSINSNYFQDYSDSSMFINYVVRMNYDNLSACLAYSY